MRIATIISLFIIFIVLVVEINGQTRRTTKRPGGRTTKKPAGRSNKKPVATKKPQNGRTTKRSGGRTTTTMDPRFRRIMPIAIPRDLDLNPETTTIDWANADHEEYRENSDFSYPGEDSKTSKSNTKKGKYKSRGRKEKNESFEEEYEYTNSTQY